MFKSKHDKEFSKLHLLYSYIQKDIREDNISHEWKFIRNDELFSKWYQSLCYNSTFFSFSLYNSFLYFLSIYDVSAAYNRTSSDNVQFIQMMASRV